MDRRTFLQGLAATIAAPFAGKGILGAKTAGLTKTAIRNQMMAEGMPSWFPMLVAKMKEKGISKVNRGQPGKGEVNNVYETERYTLLEDPMTGDVSIYGRGDDGQMFELTYRGPKKTYKKDGTFKEEEAQFDAYEKYKGEIQDYEMEGTFDDLKGSLDDLEAFAKSGKPMTKEAAEETVAKFLKKTTTEDIDLANGGRVGFANGTNPMTKEEWERKIKMQAQWARQAELASLVERLRETGDISLPIYKEGLSTQGYYNSMDDIFFGGVNYNDGNKNLHIGTTIPPEGQPEWNAKFSYSFSNGGPVIRPQGTLPPERGPMYNGISNLFRRTANGYR